MRPLVHVPHRGEMPKYLLHRAQPSELELLQQDPHYDAAIDLRYDVIHSYEGYKELQAGLVREAIDDLRFANEVEQASRRIAGVAVVSETYRFGDGLVKDETQQLTRAYKVRGATNFILKHEVEAVRAGVVTASAGNHGQGVALAAAKLGIEAVVVVPFNTPQVKIDGIESQGGLVVRHGSDYSAAADKATALSLENGGLFVPAFNHRDIMAGQATIGAELLYQAEDMTDVIVPTGGGGLLAGLSKYLSVAAPRVRVWGAGISGASALEKAYTDNNNGEANMSSFADGIAVSHLGSLTWPEIHTRAAGCLTVNEQDVRRTVGLLSLSGYTVEGAGAVGISASEQHAARLGSCVVSIATGGNIDPAVLRDCEALAIASSKR